jgi:general L-amino acid transport system substrate-binding protein
MRGMVFYLAMASLAVCTAAHAADSSSTLKLVRDRGALRCGIDTAEAEYSTADDHGAREAFDADLCRAVAVAVLGERAQIAVAHFPDDREAMRALGAGEVDLIATLTDDFTHTAGTHLLLTRPVLWDGVGFLVPIKAPMVHARQLSGKKVCFLAETTTEESVRAWFAREHLNFVPFPFQEEGEMQAAYATGNCAALAGDRTHLAETRLTYLTRGKISRLLPETISSDPLAMAVRDGDPQWAVLVGWVVEALVAAEESGVTQANVRDRQAHADDDPALRVLLGGSKEIGSALGLDNDWVVRVIAATGNYGEIYERDLGSGSSLKLPRGENRLRRQGGAMTALTPK